MNIQYCYLLFSSSYKERSKFPEGLNATEQENGAWPWRLRCSFEYEKWSEFGLQAVYGVREGMGCFRGEEDRVCTGIGLMEAMGWNGEWL